MKEVISLIKNNSIGSDLFLQNINALANYFSVSNLESMEEKKYKENELNEINVQEFLIQNTLESQEEYKEFLALKLVNALTVAHQKFTQIHIPEIEQYFLLLVDCFPEDRTLKILFNLFVKFQIDFQDHLNVEEKLVFPYIRKLYFVVENKSKSDAELILQDDYSIKNFAHSHDNNELYLTEIICMLENFDHMKNHPARNILIKKIYQMDEKIKIHANIEDTILIDEVLKLEEKIARFVNCK